MMLIFKTKMAAASSSNRLLRSSTRGRGRGRAEGRDGGDGPGPDDDDQYTPEEINELWDMLSEARNRARLANGEAKQIRELVLDIMQAQGNKRGNASLLKGTGDQKVIQLKETERDCVRREKEALEDVEVRRVLQARGFLKHCKIRRVNLLKDGADVERSDVFSESVESFRARRRAPRHVRKSYSDW